MEDFIPRKIFESFESCRMEEFLEESAEEFLEKKILVENLQKFLGDLQTKISGGIFGGMPKRNALTFLNKNPAVIVRGFLAGMIGEIPGEYIGIFGEFTGESTVGHP